MPHQHTPSELIRKPVPQISGKIGVPLPSGTRLILFMKATTHELLDSYSSVREARSGPMLSIYRYEHHRPHEIPHTWRSDWMVIDFKSPILLVGETGIEPVTLSLEG